MPELDDDKLGPAASIRVLVVDDHPTMRQALATVIDSEAGLQIVGQARNGKEAVRLAGMLEPDAVVMDVQMPDMDGAEATHLIRQRQPATVVVSLSVLDDDATRESMVRAGASAHLGKHRAVGELVAAIREACR